MTEDWRAPITLYLQGHYHPSDINEAKRLKHQSRDFALVGGQLYKKGISQPMLNCVTETEGIQILREVHSGTCGVERKQGYTIMRRKNAAVLMTAVIIGGQVTDCNDIFCGRIAIDTVSSNLFSL